MRKYDNYLHVMEVTGGSFVKALVHAYYMADPDNKRILRNSFAKYFDRYERDFETFYSNIEYQDVRSGLSEAQDLSESQEPSDSSV